MSGDNYTKFPSEYDPVRIDAISKINFNISNIVHEVLHADWTDNFHCLVELNAIKYGLRNFDEWAIRSWYSILFFQSLELTPSE